MAYLHTYLYSLYLLSCIVMYWAGINSIAEDFRLIKPVCLFINPFWKTLLPVLIIALPFHLVKFFLTSWKDQVTKTLFLRCTTTAYEIWNLGTSLMPNSSTMPTVKFTVTHAEIKEHCVCLCDRVGHVNGGACVSKNISVYISITLRLHSVWQVHYTSVKSVHH